MFGHSSSPSRIYSYKAAAPPDGHDYRNVLDQMRLAHRYRNALIEVERDRRVRVDETVRRLFPDVQDLEQRASQAEAEADALTAAIKARNQTARRRTATPEDRQALAAARVRLKEARAAHKEARKAAFADARFKAEQAVIDAEVLARQKELRAASGLYWGNYLLIEQSLSGIRSGPPPEFRKWTGDGTVAVQVQGGLPWDEVMLGQDARVRIARQSLAVRPTHSKRGIPLPVADPASARSQTKARAVVHLRVGTLPDRRSPVWALVPFHLHREPPEDSRVKWVYLHRVIEGRHETGEDFDERLAEAAAGRPRRAGYAEQWEVQFVVAREGWERPGLPDGGVAGLDLGWRLVDDGLRVAYLAGDDGREEELVIPHAWLAAWSKADSLRSIRDREFDAARGRLAAWIAGAADAGIDLPEWFRDQLAYLSRWKSPGRLSGVVWRWDARRFDGDDAIFRDMAAWRAQDRHLRDYERGLHGKVVRRRDDLYRKFADTLARSYRTVRVEAINWRELQERPGADASPEDAAERAAAGVNHRIAAVGRLRQAVAEAVAVVEPVPAAFSTLRCHACGTVDRFDKGDLFHQCSGCGDVWDQDRNAAVWLMRGGGHGEPEMQVEAAAV